ncbi:MAG: TM2 domain-containing protein [Deltaproteobacteria bacterium]|jgi:TM2 domain-containing membrane protein YozV|nr:TM2 domain-containing protein [Deltaproteobacteria bacterium]
MLLCAFFGWIGVHRFYLGRIVTGILMVITLGGLGIWALVDFIRAGLGKLKDSQGKFVNGPANVVPVVVAVVMFTLVFIFFMGTVSAVIIPQYQRYAYRRAETMSAIYVEDIIQSQKKYMETNGRYTTNAAELGEFGLVDSRSFTITEISLFNDYDTNTPCFRLSLQITVQPVPIRQFDICKAYIVDRRRVY